MPETWNAFTSKRWPRNKIIEILSPREKEKRHLRAPTKALARSRFAHVRNDQKIYVYIIYYSLYNYVAS